ncbi:DUF2267 domain-containing protein [Streptomyces sp. MK7]|uniref:DUF2267 domain-containing protein n=1 Tax=Streptomyces sp. MK7 TaxID=3067635 RepID=UPI002930E1FD|nr:DUF2267 domain-containing protein [Streptomyces sp. MK7]
MITTMAPVETTRRGTSAVRGDEAAEHRRWEELTEKVREAGQYATRPEAERVTRIVLSVLGGHVTGEERVDLAQALPREAAQVIASQIPATRPLTAPEFVEAAAARIEGSTPATARWDVSSVLSVLADTLDPNLLNRILTQLPPGYALLFGRADLSPAQ